MTRNYEQVYYVAQNVGIIGILAYPKITKICTFNSAIAICEFHTGNFTTTLLSYII